MKGTNTLKLNQETMCEALQVWIEKTFSGPNVPIVKAVKNASTSSGYGPADFEVEVESENAA